MAATTDFTINCEFTSTPDALFDLLTNQDKWDAYTGYPGGKGLSAVVGSSFSLSGMTATVAEAIKGQKLVWKDWTIAGVFPEDVKSTVTWELSPSATGGTTATLTHSGCAVVEGEDFVAYWHTHWVDPIAKFEELPAAKRQKLEKKQVTPSVCLTEIMAGDLDRAAKFYGAVFGWKMLEWDATSRFFTSAGPGAIGGGFLVQPADEFPPPGTRCGTTLVITVPNAEEAVASAVAAGGTEVKGLTTEGDGSRYALVADTEGNVVSVFQESPTTATNGSGGSGEEPPRGIRWFELNCVDVAEAKAFYSTVFGWCFTDYTPSYACIDSCVKDDRHIDGALVATDEAGAAGAAGKMGAIVYIDVDDVATYLDKVVDAGGTLHTPPTVIPGTGSNYAAFLDPNGNRVGLYGGSGNGCC